MRLLLLTLAAAVILLAGADRASAQFAYLDTNGDGLSGATDPELPPDVLNPSVTSIDIYLDTNHNPDGTSATCTESSSPMSLLSYEVLMTCTGPGKIVFGGWSNNVPGYTINLTDGPGGVKWKDRDIWIGLGVSTRPGGRYKLGTLAVSVTGNPVLTWVTSSPLQVAAEAAFGTNCEGVDFDNTYKLGKDWVYALGTTTAQPPVAPDAAWERIKTLYR